MCYIRQTYLLFNIYHEEQVTLELPLKCQKARSGIQSNMWNVSPAAWRPWATSVKWFQRNCHACMQLSDIEFEYAQWRTCCLVVASDWSFHLFLIFWTSILIDSEVKDSAVSTSNDSFTLFKTVSTSSNDCTLMFNWSLMVLPKALLIITYH